MALVAQHTLGIECMLAGCFCCVYPHCAWLFWLATSYLHRSVGSGIPCTVALVCVVFVVCIVVHLARKQIERYMYMHFQSDFNQWQLNVSCQPDSASAKHRVPLSYTLVILIFTRRIGDRRAYLECSSRYCDERYDVLPRALPRP